MARKPHPLAVASAKEVISKLGIRSPKEIDIELIAVHHNLYLTRRVLEHQDGHIVRAGKKGIVVVDERAFRSSKWRFVIAHELGHFLRHPSVDQFELCTSADLSNYVGSGRESEANDFAAELLMPEILFKQKCEIGRPSLREVSALAEQFGTSLTATALRLVGFAPEPCAVVHSTNGIVDWLDWSADFKLGIKKGTRLTRKTYAGDLAAGQSVDDRLQQVDGEAWSDNAWASDIDLFEHSRRVERESVLTVLWHASRD